MCGGVGVVVETRIIGAAAAGIGFLAEALVGGLSWLGSIVIQPIPFTGPTATVALLVGTIVALYFGTFIADATGRESTLGELMAGLQVIMALALLGVLFMFYEPAEVAGLAAFAVPLVALAWILWVYFGYRQNVSRSVAADRTRRQTRRTFENWGEFIAGLGLVIIAALLGVFSGLLSAGSGMGDVIAPYLGELAYLFTIISGYVAMGGDFAGWDFGILADLSPGAWLIVVGLVGLLAVFYRQ